MKQTNKGQCGRAVLLFPAVWRPPCWTCCCLQVGVRNKHGSCSRQSTRLRAGSKQLLGRKLQMRASNCRLLQPTVLPVPMEPTLLPSRHKPWLLRSEAQLPPWQGTKAAVDCGGVPTLRTSKYVDLARVLSLQRQLQADASTSVKGMEPRTSVSSL